MFGAVDAGLIMDVARMGGAMWQLELLDEVPFIELDLKYLTDIPMKYSWKSASGYGTQWSIDHPCFTVVRERLAHNGFIHMEKGWSNGDRVLKPFYINRYLFEPDEKFCCAAAQQYHIKKFMESEEYKRRDPDYFIYGGNTYD